MTMLYPIVLETEESGAVSAYVPGLPVYAAADSHAKAERAIRAVLAEYLERAPGESSRRTSPRRTRLRSREDASQRRWRCRSGGREAQRREGACLACQRPARRAPSEERDHTNDSDEGIALTRRRGGISPTITRHATACRLAGTTRPAGSERPKLDPGAVYLNGRTRTLS
jgi:predicted RNase H-like HicB family nuclease